MFTIAVCDDNEKFAVELKNQIDHFCFSLPDNLEIKVQIFHRGLEFLHYLKEHLVQIVFLNIDMPDMEGLALAESLHGKYPKMVMIFITSPQNLIYSFSKFLPFYMIHKNHLKKELHDTLQSAVTECLNRKDSHIFSTTEGDKFLLLKYILYLESQKNYYILHCVDADYKCRGSLGKMESLLSTHGFYRIHASFLINMEHLKAFSAGNKVCLTDGSLLSISRAKTAEVKDKYIEYLQMRISP